MSKVVRYRNVHTGAVATYASVMATLERSPNWERHHNDVSPPPAFGDQPSDSEDAWVADTLAHGDDSEE